MRHAIQALAVGAALASGWLPSGPAFAQETYDLLFRTGTLDAVSRDTRLVYSREVLNTLQPEAADRDTGQVELTFEGGEPEAVRLEFFQNEKHRTVGDFPASVGNPIIMYFVETVVRDMAETAGGSPYYIRNRVKDALVTPATIEQQQIESDGQTMSASVVTLHPFDGDPNAARMQGFGNLELTVTMSEDVPGWYQSLVAKVPGDGGDPIYSSVLTLEPTE